MTNLPTNDTFRHLPEAIARAHERAQDHGVAYFVTGGETARGYVSVVCSRYFDPGAGMQIYHAAWPAVLKFDRRI